jgi:WD40 repeat protein
VTAARFLLSRRTVLISLASHVAVGGGLTGVTLASKPARGTLFHTFPQGDIEHTVAWSPDGMRIVSGSADQTVQVWSPSPSAGEALHYSGHSDAVDAVAWSPDGQRLASGSVDKTVRVWDLSSTGNPYIYREHTDEVYTVAWSPGGFPWPWSHEGQRLASGGKDTTVRLWQAV